MFSINTYSLSSKRTIISTEKSQNILVEICLFLTFGKISKSSVKKNAQNVQNRYIAITSRLACSLFENKTKAFDLISGIEISDNVTQIKIMTILIWKLIPSDLTQEIIACAARYKSSVNPMLKRIQMDTSDLCLKKKNQIFIFSFYILERFF